LSNLSPIEIERTADDDEIVEMVEPDGTSHNRIVESREAETILRPTPTMAVAVTERVCPRRVRAGWTVIDEGLLVVEFLSGRSAGRMDNEKSKPVVKSTREEGKNRTVVTPLK
jgi:hypothetical protein